MFLSKNGNKVFKVINNSGIISLDGLVNKTNLSELEVLIATNELMRRQMIKRVYGYHSYYDWIYSPIDSWHPKNIQQCCFPLDKRYDNWFSRLYKEIKIKFDF